MYAPWSQTRVAPAVRHANGPRLPVPASFRVGSSAVASSDAATQQAHTHRRHQQQPRCCPFGCLCQAIRTCGRAAPEYERGRCEDPCRHERHGGGRCALAGSGGGGVFDSAITATPLVVTASGRWRSKGGPRFQAICFATAVCERQHHRQVCTWGVCTTSYMRGVVFLGSLLTPGPLLCAG